MIERYITPKDFESYLKGFIGKKIVKIYYITDCMVEFRAGRRFLSRLDTVKNKSIPVYEYEYELSIWGHWRYIAGGKIVESTFVRQEEDAPVFRRRIGGFVESLHPKTVVGIRISKKGMTAEITLDNGGKFIVRKFEDTFVSYSNTILNENGKPVKYRHARPEEFTGKLQYTEAP